jgi:hypothetical protein
MFSSWCICYLVNATKVTKLLNAPDLEIAKAFSQWNNGHIVTVDTWTLPQEDDWLIDCPTLPETKSMCQQNISGTITLHFPETRSMCQQHISGTITLHFPRDKGHVSVDTWTFSRGSVAQWLHWPFVDTWTLSRGSVAQWYHWHFVETWTLSREQCEIKTFVFFLLFFIKYNYLNCYPPPRNNDYVSRNCLSYHGHTCTWALHLPVPLILYWHMAFV